MDEKTIRNIAEHFRAAIAQSDRQKLAIGLRSFPMGACSDSALLPGTYLSDQKIGDFFLISGEMHRNGQFNSHGWLEGNGLIVDITADQFPENDDGVIVTGESAWHDGWTKTNKGVAQMKRWQFAGPLDESYAEIHRHMYQH